MPYRRSRLQDYYEEFLGPDPSDGGSPAEPESEESQPNLPPYVYPSVPLHPQPEPPPIPNDIVAFVPPALPPVRSEPDPVIPGEPHAVPGGPTHGNPPTVYAPVNPLPTTASGTGYVFPDATPDGLGDIPPTEQPSDFVAPDIGWDPETGQAELLDICDRLCQQNPQAMTAVMNLIEGADPDDEEQTLRDRVEHHLRNLGMNDDFGRGDWYTTRLDSLYEDTAKRTVDNYFDSVGAALATMPVTEAESTTVQSQGRAGTSEFVQPEISIGTQRTLWQCWPDEWDPKETTATGYKDFLISRQDKVIEGFNADALNWDGLSVKDSTWEHFIALENELRALEAQGLEYSSKYREVLNEYLLADELLSAVEPIPLDDTRAYDSALRFVHIPDAEAERWHVVRQLEIIFKHLNIEVADNYFESRSNTELKYELYEHLRFNVLPFLDSKEMEDQSRIANFMDEYLDIARDIPRNVVSQLEGSYQNPDVFGFMFMMGIFGLSIVYEPIDWTLTGVDVVDALSEDDKESAKQHLFFGTVPLLKSGMVDVGQSLLKHSDFLRVLPISSWNKAQREALERGRITAPGSSGDLHTLLSSGKFETRPPKLRYNSKWRSANSPENKISANAENIIGEQFRDLGYNVIINPTRLQLDEIGYKSRKKPDFIIEERVFDAMSVRTDKPMNMVSRLSREKLIRSQSDRIH